jgi:hypothetical protein
LAQSPRPDKAGVDIQSNLFLVIKNKIQGDLQMITLFGQHGVTDFEAWKRGGEEFREGDFNEQWGIVETSMYRTVDSSGVIVTHDFNDLESAQYYKNMMESAETQARLDQMGAKLPLTIWLAEKM